MFSKKGFRVLLLGAMTTFFLIALFVYMFYIKRKPKVVKVKPPVSHQIEESVEDQAVMAGDLDRILADTNVVFEIVDQSGIVRQTNMYPGVNWLDLSKVQLAQMYPDYIIKNFEKDQVLLSRKIERKMQADYILTTQDGHIIISILEDGHKKFYKDTGLEQHDFSRKVEQALEHGISITCEQKDAILEDADELYMILQEYDE